MEVLSEGLLHELKLQSLWIKPGHELFYKGKSVPNYWLKLYDEVAKTSEMKINRSLSVVNNENYASVTFDEALYHYEQGKTIECRILNDKNEIIDWEKYNICDGLEVALEFNEIINGHWYVLVNGY